MKIVLLDTDVILDFFFDRKPYADDAREVLTLCENGKIKGYTTPVIIANVYYLLRKTAKHDIVIARIKLLLTIIDVINMDRRAVLGALNSAFKDFEDALQHFAAQEHGAVEAILTRNVKDFKKSTLPVLTPESYLKMITIL